MTKYAIEAIAEKIKSVEDKQTRKLFAKLMWEVVEENATGTRPNEVAFAILCNVPYDLSYLRPHSC